MSALDFTEALISRQPLILRRRVGWGECDPAGVVYTPRFVEYVLSARDWFLRESLGVLDRPHPSRTGLTFPMRAMSYEFEAFLAADYMFDMLVKVADVSNRTFTIDVICSHADGRRAFSARLTSVCVDSAIGKAVPFPDAMRAALDQYRAAQPD